MHNVWKNFKDKINTYNLEIGNYIFTIRTSQENLSLPFEKLEGNKDLPIIKINIWLEDTPSFRKYFLDICENSAKSFIPKELKWFYEKINNTFYLKHNIFGNPNRYYKRNSEVFACFNYITDNFYLNYSYNNNNIYIVGNNNNLNRIILDFLTVSQEFLPLHGSAVECNNRAIGLISDSNCGKTTLLIKLLEKGFAFLTDDSLFIQKDSIVKVSNLLSIRKGFENNKKIADLTKQIQQEKMMLDINNLSKILGFKTATVANNIKIYTLKRKEQDKYQFIKMRQPFPCIANQSFWCLHYLIQENEKEYINDVVDKSVKKANEILENANNLIVELEEIEETIEKIVKGDGMSKILVSDYDNTFFENEEKIKINVKSINKFREKGNIFVLSTARSIESMQREIEKYDIKYDYLICSTGAVIVDNKGRVIYSNYIEEQEKNIIEKQLQKTDLEIHRLGIKCEVENENKDVIGYKIKGKEEKINELKERLNKFTDKTQIIVRDKTKMFLNNKSNTKTKSLKIFLEKLKMDKNKVITVGDDDIDLGMLLNYDGYRMKKSSELLRLNIKKEVESVSDLV